jgi:hypothetical protein
VRVCEGQPSALAYSVPRHGSTRARAHYNNCATIVLYHVVSRGTDSKMCA